MSPRASLWARRKTRLKCFSADDDSVPWWRKSGGESRHASSPSNGHRAASAINIHLLECRCSLPLMAAYGLSPSSLQSIRLLRPSPLDYPPLISLRVLARVSFPARVRVLALRVCRHFAFISRAIPFSSSASSLLCLCTFPLARVLFEHPSTFEGTTRQYGSATSRSL